MDATNWTSAIRDLAAAYVSTLLGKQPFVIPPAAAALAGVTLHPSGAWRYPHPLVTTRGFLSEVVDAYVNNPAAERRVNRPTAAAVVRLVWGLDGHPLSVQEAQERLGLIPTRAAERWPNQICADSAVHALAATTHARLQPPHEPYDSVPDGIDLNRALPGEILRTAAGALRQELDERTRRMSEAERCEHIKHTIYYATREQMARWFGKGRPVERERYLRYFLLEASGAWFPNGDDPWLMPSAGIAKPRGGSYAKVTRSALTVCLYLAVSDTDGLKAALLMHLELMEPAKISRDFNYILHTILDEQAREDERADAMILVPPAGFAFPPDETTTAERLWHLAGACRQASGFDPTVACGLIEQYLRARPAVLSGASSSEDHVLIALADHSVHWDTIAMEARDLEDRVRYEIRTRRGSERMGYLTHTHRAPALLANKENDWTRATFHAVAGLRELAEMNRDGLIQDRDEFLSAAEQLWLAMAGISIRRMEALLARPADRVPSSVAAQACRTALAASGLVMECLEMLDGTDPLHPENGTGMPLARHEHGRIDSKVWWIRALIIRLRALLGVRTTIGAGMTSEHSVFEDVRRGQLPWTTLSLQPSARDRADLDLGYIRDLYTTLITQPTLAPALRQELVTLALWLSLVNGQSLPVHLHTAPALSGLSFLTPQASNQQQRQLKVSAVANWMSRDEERYAGGKVIAYDAWVLSWLPYRTATSRWLDLASSGMYMAFRKEHDVRRPPAPSHD